MPSIYCVLGPCCLKACALQGDRLFIILLWFGKAHVLQAWSQCGSTEVVGPLRGGAQCKVTAVTGGSQHSSHRTLVSFPQNESLQRSKTGS